MLDSQTENLGESDSWSTLLCLFLLGISTLITCYCLILQTGVVSECNSAGSWAIHLDFLYAEAWTWDFFFSVSLTQPFSPAVTHGCQSWLEMAVTDTGQLKISSQTSHNCHPCAEILKTMPNIGATAGNCSFFLYRFSTLSQVPQGWGYSKTSGRPKVTYAWNVRICEKIFPNMSRGESDMTVPWVGKKWTPLQSDLWINTMSPRDLNLLWNF